MIKILALNLHLLATLTLTLTSAFTFIDCFQKVNFQKGIKLVMRKFELSSTFLYERCELFKK